MDKINSLMMAPNLDSPLNNEAANDYKNGSWANKAKQITQQYAKWSKYNHPNISCLFINLKIIKVLVYILINVFVDYGIMIPKLYIK